MYLLSSEDVQTCHYSLNTIYLQGIYIVLGIINTLEMI